MSYFFEKTQKLRFVIVDCDNEQTMTGDEIGAYECTLGQIMGSRGQTL